MRRVNYLVSGTVISIGTIPGIYCRTCK